MPYQQGETWRFQVRDHEADRVYLVRYSEAGLSLWTAMEQHQPGVWETVLHLDPGQYRFAYFTCEGSAFFNGGTFGLTGERLTPRDPAVRVLALPRPTAPTAPAAPAAPADLPGSTRTSRGSVVTSREAESRE